MTAGTDGRICHYHWRPTSTQHDSNSSNSSSRDTDPSLTCEHTSLVAHHSGSANTTHDCHGSGDSSGGLAVRTGQVRGQSRPGADGLHDRQHDRQPDGPRDRQPDRQPEGQGDRHANQEDSGASSGVCMSLICVAEERMPNITTVQDIVEIAGSKEQLVCGFQVLLLLLLLLRLPYMQK